MSDEMERPKRRTLGDTHLREGDRMRVYFPGGRQPEVLVATGRRNDDDRVVEMRTDDGARTEWVPTWLVAVRIGRKI